jgi:glycosyltransferase involved in cell wall biosynthesis
MMEGFPSKVYGTGNEDLGSLNGGEMPFEKQKEIYRNSRVFVYGGTYPASYTLSFMEAMMTGTPIVAIGSGLAHIQRFESFDFYEIPDFISDGINGFCHDDIASLRNAVRALMNDKALAEKISSNARAKAIELFGKETIGKQWKGFLDK